MFLGQYKPSIKRMKKPLFDGLFWSAEMKKKLNRVSALEDKYFRGFEVYQMVSKNIVLLRERECRDYKYSETMKKIGSPERLAAWARYCETYDAIIVRELVSKNLLIIKTKLGYKWTTFSVYLKDEDKVVTIFEPYIEKHNFLTAEELKERKNIQKLYYEKIDYICNENRKLNELRFFQIKEKKILKEKIERAEVEERELTDKLKEYEKIRRSYEEIAAYIQKEYGTIL